MNCKKAAQILILALCFAGFVNLQALAEPTAPSASVRPWQVPCAVLKVTDGDTLKVRIATWPWETRELGLRLYGVDTPESRPQHAKTDRELLVGKLVSRCVDRWLKDRGWDPDASKVDFRFVAEHAKRDKYAGRFVGFFYFEREGDLGPECLNCWLIESKLARVYHGGKKEGWTDSQLDAAEAFARKFLEMPTAAEGNGE